MATKIENLIIEALGYVSWIDNYKRDSVMAKLKYEQCGGVKPCTDEAIKSENLVRLENQVDEILRGNTNPPIDDPSLKPLPPPDDPIEHTTNAEPNKDEPIEVLEIGKPVPTPETDSFGTDDPIPEITLTKPTPKKRPKH